MRRRGVALVLVLWIIVLAGAVTSVAAVRARESTLLSGTIRARSTASAAAESGIAAAAEEIEARLRMETDSTARRTFLNDTEHALRQPDLALGEARAQIIVIDPAARLDVNSATATQLATLFAFFTDANSASSSGSEIRRAIDGNVPGGATRPFRSLEALRSVPGVPAQLLVDAAPYLTIDGDGRVNRVTASRPVLRAAAGDLVDEPSRLLLVSRGWSSGHPLTHEVQAVFAIAREPTGDRLVLLRWRERDL